MFYPMYTGGLYSAAADAQSQAAAASTEAREAKSESELVRRDIERLLMITEALWQFMKKEHGYSDEDLVGVINQIDMRDGRLDGRVAPTPPAPCPACGKINARNRSMCMYCGKPLPTTPFAH